MYRHLVYCSSVRRLYAPKSPHHPILIGILLKTDYMNEHQIAAWDDEGSGLIILEWEDHKQSEHNAKKGFVCWCKSFAPSLNLAALFLLYHSLEKRMEKK